MANHKSPTNQLTELEHLQFRRSLLGTGVTLIAFMGWLVAAAELLTRKPEWTLAVTALYNLVLLVGTVCVSVWPIRRLDHLTEAERIRGCLQGAHICLWMGTITIIAGLWCGLATESCQHEGISLTMTGLLLIYWSSRYPRVKQIPAVAQWWQYSTQQLIAAAVLAALYMGAVVFMDRPDEHVLWKLLKPAILFGFIGWLCSLIVAPIRVTLCVYRWIRKKAARE